MARIRTIKPEFWEDEVVGAISRDARLLFIAIWTNADDEGLIRWNAPFLKSAAFAYDDDIDVEAVVRLMGELTDRHLVFEYRGQTQQRLGWVLKFHRHQVINRPSPSKLPPPSIFNADVRLAYGRRDRMVCKVCGNAINPNASALKDRLSLDHTIPREKGGSDYPSNLSAAHQRCNSSKGIKQLPKGVVAETPANSSLNLSQSDSVNDSVSESMSDSLLEGKGREGKGVRGDVPKKPKPAKRAPADFQPDRELAVAKLPEVDVDAEIQKFRDWEFKTAKTDWAATWRNWVAGCQERGRWAKLQAQAGQSQTEFDRTFANARYT